MKWTIDHRSRERLQDQIAGCARRGVSSGELDVGEQLPPAAELAAALAVDRNTVLAAYRQLRDEGVLEFRRGRGARVAAAGPKWSSVTEAARSYIAVARAQGLETGELLRIIKEMT
jgi:GntR family transcriptional regulator